MLKIFRNCSLARAVPSSYLLFFFCFYLFQIFIKFLNPELHGLWRDETATLFFSSHLEKIFQGDSHSFFYYAFFYPLSWFAEGDLFSYRLAHIILSLILSMIIVVRSSKVLKPDQWFFFNTVYGFHPLVLGLTRLARPYGLMIDLAALLIIEIKIYAQEKKKLPVFLVSFSLASIHPLGLIPFFTEWLFAKKKDKRSLFKLFLWASLPVIIYYLLKVAIEEKPTGYIGWIKSSPFVFWSDLNSMLLGSYFPFYHNLSFELVNIIFCSFVFLLLIALKFIKEKNEIYKFFCLYLCTYVGIGFLSYVQDLRIPRYYVTLFPYFLLAISSLVPQKMNWSRGITILVSFLLILRISIFAPYFEPKISLGSMLHLSKVIGLNRHFQVMTCGYDFQTWYFKRQGFLVCDSPEDLQKIKSNPDGFVYMCMDNLLLPLVDLSKNRSLVDRIPFHDGQVMVISALKD